MCIDFASWSSGDKLWEGSGALEAIIDVVTGSTCRPEVDPLELWT